MADQLGDVLLVRRLMAALATQLGSLNVTLLLTLTGSLRDEQLITGLTSGDFVLGLHYRLEGMWHWRRLEVVNQRGCRQLPGAHSYTITRTGLTITPQLEVRAPQFVQSHPRGRLAFQVAELDQQLGGGLMAGTATLVVGAPGVGKTMLGLHWTLAAAEPTGTSMFLRFDERLPELQMAADFLELPFAPARKAGALTLLQLNPDEVAERVLASLTPHKPARGD